MPPLYCLTAFVPVSARPNRARSSSARAPARRRAQVVEPAEHLQVLPAAELLVDGGVLAEQPDP